MKVRSISPAERYRLFGKASAHASYYGSLTVECALILPLFFLGMVTLIGFMEIYAMQTEKLLNLCDTAKKAGMYAYVEGKAQEEITLPIRYSYESPVSLIPLPKIWMKNSVTVHTWTGYGGCDDGQGEKGAEVEEMVYVTVHGGVYHTHENCNHLDLSIHQVTAGSLENLRNDSGGKYYPCEHCSRGNCSPTGLVYITDTGNRYHVLAGCSDLKRTVRLVKKSELKNLSQCKDCAKKD